ncbi:MAG: TIGR01212 family radical SAM protein [Gammaproteobacteria bacterium]|nr:TIGR01212 family radical SAM protein [Gammaproteobacteria bacterium]
MILSNYVNTFGQSMLDKHQQRVHKIAIDADFTCPNRDGTIGRGGCTFCNNVSFSPNGRQPAPLNQQIDAGKKVLIKRTRAKKYLAYFQAYTNTYADINILKNLYDSALAEQNVIGLCIGTRPDCVPAAVLDLLTSYQDQGYEVWLELGLQSSYDKTLERVNRGHDYATYCKAIKEAHSRQLSVCTHLIIGLPGEDNSHAKISLLRVLEQGVEGLKLHPLHVVKGTQLANEWRRGEYQALSMHEYINTVADLVALTPKEIIFHRLTGTAQKNILLAPEWCSQKWNVLNGITAELRQRGHRQGIEYGAQSTWSL